MKTALLALLLLAGLAQAAEPPPMKYILILLMEAGTGVVTADRMAAISAEFDDLKACESVLNWFAKNSSRVRPTGVCLPKASKPETVEKVEK